MVLHGMAPVTRPAWTARLALVPACGSGWTSPHHPI